MTLSHDKPHVSKRNPFQVRRSLPILPSDVDAARFVTPSAYARWLDQLQDNLLSAKLGITPDASTGSIPLLISTQTMYNSPIRSGDRPFGRMWLIELGYTQWTLYAEIGVGRRIAATATQTGSQVNQITLRPIPVPEELSRAYWDYQWNL